MVFWLIIKNNVNLTIHHRDESKYLFFSKIKTRGYLVDRDMCNQLSRITRITYDFVVNTCYANIFNYK